MLLCNKVIYITCVYVQQCVFVQRIAKYKICAMTIIQSGFAQYVFCKNEMQASKRSVQQPIWAIIKSERFRCAQENFLTFKENTRRRIKVAMQMICLRVNINVRGGGQEEQFGELRSSLIVDPFCHFFLHERAPA